MTRIPPVVLFVEDNPDHAELVLESFAEHGAAHVIRHVSDGAQALDYLYRRGDWAAPERSPRPQLVLLDLRLPKVDGLEVLRTIKADPVLQRTPVVVLTTSAAEADLTRAYDAAANAYLVKPLDFAQFERLVRDLGEFWLAWNVRAP